MEKLQLYYHFPFCLSKCAYCAFYSLPAVSDDLIEAYVNELIKQTLAFDSDGYEVSSVFFGGGTPTVAGEKRLSAVLHAVFERFRVQNDAEITVEANPRTIGLDGLRHLKNAGFNRLSLGAQSFNDKTLCLLKRAHNANDFTDCFNSARKAGFHNISADLIFALPNESDEMLLNSVKRLIALSPEHISVYNLSVEEGTELWAKKESLSFPDEEGEERQYTALCSLLASAGYNHYEISNFAKAGFESRHNTGYWKRVPYFGFGAGAHSFFGGRRFSTDACIERYIGSTVNSAFDATNFSTSYVIGDREAEEERIMLGLRLAEGVDINKEVPQFLLDNRLVECRNGRVCITEKGYRVSNAIISQFI